MSGENDDDDDDEDLSKTVEMHAAMRVDPSREIDNVLADLEGLLKNGDVVSALSEKGINASLALLAAQGLASYLHGRKEEAAEDLRAVAEEISDRLALAAAAKPKPN
jgi:hypothetical protein